MVEGLGLEHGETAQLNDRRVGGSGTEFRAFRRGDDHNTSRRPCSASTRPARAATGRRTDADRRPPARCACPRRATAPCECNAPVRTPRRRSWIRAMRPARLWVFDDLAQTCRHERLVARLAFGQDRDGGVVAVHQVHAATCESGDKPRCTAVVRASATTRSARLAGTFGELGQQPSAPHAGFTTTSGHETSTGRVAQHLQLSTSRSRPIMSGRCVRAMVMRGGSDARVQGCAASATRPTFGAEAFAHRRTAATSAR